MWKGVRGGVELLIQKEMRPLQLRIHIKSQYF